MENKQHIINIVMMVRVFCELFGPIYAKVEN